MSGPTPSPAAPAVAVAPGTIAVFSDLVCPFAHVLVHRLFTARRRLGLDGAVRLDHHAFPLELLNRVPGTRIGSDSEIPALGRLEPDAGWQLWQGPDHHYPNTLLLAFEAVQAAKLQSLEASEELDRALRQAFWARSRPIQMHHEILAIADDSGAVDVDALDAALRAGTARAAVFADAELAATDTVTVSPHVFLADGSDVANPGITVHWQGDWAKGFPVVDHDDPTVVDDLLLRTVGAEPKATPASR
jgi:predicted DsbA family dithiol-disulfide isomerase